MKNLAFAGIAALALAGPAFAASTSDQISLCASALDAQGLAPADAFKTEFVSVRGASLRTIVMKLIPRAEGAEQLAECRIRRGEVIGAAILS